MAIVANFLISLIARGARFLKDTPWTCCFEKECLISLPSYAWIYVLQCVFVGHQANRVDFIKLI